MPGIFQVYTLGWTWVYKGSKSLGTYQGTPLMMEYIWLKPIKDSLYWWACLLNVQIHFITTSYIICSLCLIFWEKASYHVAINLGLVPWNDVSGSLHSSLHKREIAARGITWNLFVIMMVFHGVSYVNYWASGVINT